MKGAQAIVFWRGRTSFEIARADEGEGYIGRRNGKVHAQGINAASVARALIMTDQWFKK